MMNYEITLANGNKLIYGHKDMVMCLDSTERSGTYEWRASSIAIGKWVIIHRCKNDSWVSGSRVVGIREVELEKVDEPEPEEVGAA